MNTFLFPFLEKIEKSLSCVENKPMKKAKVKVKVFQNLNGIKILKEEIQSGLKIINKYEQKILRRVNYKQNLIT
jgi:hypothetical protein